METVAEVAVETVDEATRESGRKVCREFLAGSWETAGTEDFLMERIHGGLSNLLYLCSLSDKVKVKEGEQRRVLVRYYGQIIRENPESVLTDSVIFSLLAEKGLGPMLYGVFTSGRVEQYVPSRVLRTAELHNGAVSKACARIMAQFHKLSMPIVKQPRWLFDTMTRYLEEALNNVSFEGEGDQEKRTKLQRLMAFNLAFELHALKILLSKVQSPVVFCHNDLQEGNILFVEDHADSSKGDAPSWQVRPIDFEYASYNYRGFDIGNHFCEWCYDYTASSPPYFAARLSDFPSRAQQLVFLRAYLDEYAAVSQSPSTPRLADSGEASEAERRLAGAETAGGAESREREAELMLIEVGAFALASHFLWGLWAIVQANMSDIEFGYLDYSLARFTAYFEQKQRLLSSPLAAHLRPNSPLPNSSHSLAFSESTNGGSEAWTNGVAGLVHDERDGLTNGVERNGVTH